MLKITATTESETEPGMLWLNCTDEAQHPSASVGEQILVALDGDSTDFQATILRSPGQGRMLVLLDRVARTEQVYIADEDTRSPIGRPLVDPGAA